MVLRMCACTVGLCVRSSLFLSTRGIWSLFALVLGGSCSKEGPWCEGLLNTSARTPCRMDWRSCSGEWYTLVADSCTTECGLSELGSGEGGVE